VTDLLGRHPELVVLGAVARDAPARTVVDVLEVVPGLVEVEVAVPRPRPALR